jgi:hypothetical protein
MMRLAVPDDLLATFVPHPANGATQMQAFVMPTCPRFLATIIQRTHNLLNTLLYLNTAG